MVSVTHMRFSQNWMMRIQVAGRKSLLYKAILCIANAIGLSF